MVLEVKGAVEVRPAGGTAGPARAMRMLYPGDRLKVGEQGEVRIMILKDNHRERVGPGTAVTVDRDGCKSTREKGVKREPPEKLKPVANGLRTLEQNGRGAVKIFRSDTTEPPRPTTLKDRPALSWPPVPKATGYTVQVLTAGTNRPVWTARTKETRLPYPRGEKPLRRGRSYVWRLLADLGEGETKKVSETKFAVASASDVADLEALAGLIKSKSPPDLLLAALAYHSYGAYEESLRLFEELARLVPTEAAYHAACAEYYEWAGRKEKAREAWERAKKLGYEVPKEE
jgi:hypothetical protein